MPEDMSELLNSFSNMLKEDKIPNDIKEILNNVASNNKEGSSNTSSSNNDGINITPEMLNNISKLFSGSTGSSNNSNSSDNSSNTNIDMETLLKMKSIMETMNSTKDDPRSNLLYSLKPYLKESRKSKLDQYVKMFNMTKVMDVFNNMGGDKKK